MNLEKLIDHVETGYKGWNWLVRSDGVGYFANIYSTPHNHHAWGSTPEEALNNSLELLKEGLASRSMPAVRSSSSST